MHHAAEAGMRKRKCGQDLLPHVAALFIFICCCFQALPEQAHTSKQAQQSVLSAEPVKTPFPPGPQRICT